MRNLQHLILVVLLAVLAGCSSTPSRPPAAATPSAPAPRPAGPVSQAPAAMPAPAQTQAVPDNRRDYVVGAGDLLKITVYQNADLSLDARVSESGVISYPLLGQVTVGGLSIAQVETTIADGLKKGNFIKQPQVSVLLSQVRGNQASVLGMAGRPGRYPIEVKGMRLSELLALAGGVAPGGSEIVTLSGVREGKPYRLKADISTLFTGATGEDPIVLNGDTLYIDKLPNIYIYGEVQRPGPIPLLADMTVMQALASGGGLTQRGTQRGMKISRRDAAGNVTEIDVRSMSDVLKPNDVIYVKESLF